ncbi:MAG: hypothetical protein AB7O62_00030 [Pirellulales bacterium]
MVASNCLAAAPPDDQPDTKAGVAAAVGYLLNQQQPEGFWKIDAGSYTDGVSALCTLALLNGGVDVQDERMQRALRWLRGQEPSMTYSRVLQTLAYCRAGAAEDAERIRANVMWLADAQAKDGEGQGGWSYGPAAGGRADGSCTRFAIWALDAARRAGVEVPEEVWRLNADYWLKSQLADGGWAYTPSGTSGTVTMTLSGISCLSAINDALADKPLQERTVPTIERAWKRHDAWCTDAQPIYLKANGFRLYTFQLLGQAARGSSRDKIGDAAWRPWATRLLLADQQAESGHWSDASFGGTRPVVGSSLALLFLTEK